LIDAARAEQQAIKSNVIQPAYKAAFDAAGDSKIDVSKVVSEAERILDRKLSEFATETAPDTVRKLRSFVPKVPEAEAVSIGKAGFKTAKPPTPPWVTPEATLLQLDDVRKAINADIAAAGIVQLRLWHNNDVTPINPMSMPYDNSSGNAGGAGGGRCLSWPHGTMGRSGGGRAHRPMDACLCEGGAGRTSAGAFPRALEAVRGQGSAAAMTLAKRTRPLLAGPENPCLVRAISC
jgi:hypothetical protein